VSSNRSCGEWGEGTLGHSAFIFKVLDSAGWDGAPNFPPHGLGEFNELKIGFLGGVASVPDSQIVFQSKVGFGFLWPGCPDKNMRVGMKADGDARVSFDGVGNSLLAKADAPATIIA
jgi:hypothetical protein